MKLAERYEYNPSIDRLGKGGFGTVYKATDLETKRLVALKFVQRSKIPERYTLAQEIERIKKLSHPNLVKYYDILRKEYQNVAGEIDEMQIGVMEYVNGGDLSSFMKNASSHKSQTLRKILVGILQGLKYLHDNRFIHRDIKPQNILLKIDNQVVTPKLADFSLSKELSQEMTSVSAAVGTYEYMSPEQLGNDRSKINEQTDIWAFGVMCYQILTSHLPFGSRRQGATDAQIIASIVQAKLPDDVDTLPEPFPEIIRGCLQSDLQNRYKSVLPILELLDTNDINTASTSLSETLPVDSTSFFEEDFEALPTEIPEEEVPEPELTIKPSVPEIEAEETVVPIEEIKAEPVVSTSVLSSQDTHIPVEPKVEEELIVSAESTTDNRPLWIVSAFILLVLMAIAWFYLDKQNKVPALSNKSTIEIDSTQNSEELEEEKEEIIDSVQKSEPKVEQTTTRRATRQPDPLPRNVRTPRDREENAPNPTEDTTPRTVEYDYTESYSGGSIVRLNGKYGYIDTNGRQVIPLQYEDFVNFSEGLAAVKKGGKWGFVDKNNRVIITFRYKRPGSFRGGEAQVWLGQQKIYINKKGQCVRDCP